MKELVLFALTIIYYILLIRILASWILLVSPGFSDNVIYQFLRDMTDPILIPFRRLMSPVGMVDFSPILAFLAILALRALVARL